MSGTKKIEFNLDSRQTKSVELPSFPWSEVIVYPSLLVSDQREIEGKFKGPDNKVDESKIQDFSLALLVKSIKSWNFTKDGQDLEITAEILQSFPSIDFLVLNEAITGKKLTHKNDAGDLVAGAGDDSDSKKK